MESKPTSRGGGVRVLGVKWAPVNTPLQRRLQTLAACMWFVSLVFGGLFGMAVVLAGLFTSYWWLSALYMAWMVYDRGTCQSGSRGVSWVRGWAWWRYFRDYFPIELVKTAELDPKRNYLLCSYPHGVLSAGAFGCFATDALNVKEVFPGMQPNLVTLHQHFNSPFVRDLALALGTCSSTERSISAVLRDPGGGRMAVLVVGGAAESLLARPSQNQVLINRRKGFCRLALKYGTPLVPVFSFGENKLYDQVENPEGSLLLRVQEFLRSIVGMAPVIPIGRGLFQYSFGLVPRRAPVTVVVGAPIEVEQKENPTEGDILELRERFKKALEELYETHKEKCLPGENIPLIIK